MAQLKDTTISGNLMVAGGGKINGNEISAIVESGSNYIRYEDGLQICYNHLTDRTGSPGTFTLPKPFKDTNYAIVMTHNANASSSDSTTNMTRRVGSIFGKTTSTFKSYYIWDATDYIAIGRWK